MADIATTRLNPFRTLPNLLTLLRICLAPFLVATILDGNYGLSFGLFVAAGLTDALDGVLARLLKQRSMFGQYLDPVADKALLSTLFLVLMHQGLIPVRVTVMVFGRDVGILLVAHQNPMAGVGSLCGRVSPVGARCNHGAHRGFGPALRMARVKTRRRFAS